MNYCQDCKHFCPAIRTVNNDQSGNRMSIGGPEDAAFDYVIRCYHPKGLYYKYEDDKFLYKTGTNRRLCIEMRKDEELCGNEGTLFEARS